MKCEHRAWIFTILQHPPFPRERTQQLKKKYIFTATIATQKRERDWAATPKTVHSFATIIPLSLQEGKQSISHRRPEERIISDSALFVGGPKQVTPSKVNTHKIRNTDGTP